MISKYFKTAFFVSFIFFMSGCAALDSVSSFEIRPHNERWSVSSDYYSYEGMEFTLHWNRYENNNFSIYLSPRGELGRNLALGFSYIPIMIPNFFSLGYELLVPDSDSLGIAIVIYSMNSQSVIDLTKVSFLVNDESISPDKIFCSKIVDDTTTYHGVGRDPNYLGIREINYYNYGKGRINLNNEKLYVVMYLPIKRNKVKTIRVNFNELTIDNKVTSIDELKLVRTRSYIYVPDILLRALNH